MKSTTIYVLPAFACIVLTSMISLCAADNNNSSKPDSWLPSDNQTVNCPMYKSCSGDICHFNGNASEPVSRTFNANDELIVTCGNTKVDIVYPATKDVKFIGNKTYTCFQYDNGNGTTFSVALVVLNKPEDVKGSQLTCTSTQNNCTLLNETSSLIFVAGFPSSCVPWAPPPPTTTTPEPTTTTPSTTATPTTNTPAQSSTATTKSNSSATTGSVTTAGGSTETTTKSSNPGTTSSPVQITTPSSADVARLELKTVAAIATVLLIRQYL